ncbi:DUF2149 domain-containing protein [Ideonella livida]|uniref:DUF2149 domain-containing protein n=1 Tax=Ideonella livida TaxID=2707176 RepID=UPI001940221D|nr:DUF2149 domain-containing protein [Ideonella livida]
MITERLLHDEDEDPVLSLVNLIDVFLVIIAALLLAVGQHPLRPFAQEEDYTLIRRPGQADMEIITRKGQKLEHYRAESAPPTDSGGGQGVRAGVAYRLPDGSMMFVPE